MCVLSIKVPRRKKSGNLFNDPRIIFHAQYAGRWHFKVKNTLWEYDQAMYLPQNYNLWLHNHLIPHHICRFSANWNACFRTVPPGKNKAKSWISLKRGRSSCDPLQQNPFTKNFSSYLLVCLCSPFSGSPSFLRYLLSSHLCLFDPSYLCFVHIPSASVLFCSCYTVCVSCLTLFPSPLLAELAGAAKYIDCISAVG